jgi:hypothetical protein
MPFLKHDPRKSASKPRSSTRVDDASEDQPSARGFHPREVLHLQQSIGNQAVQRLIVDSGFKLYAPKTWIDTKIDDREETIRDIVEDGSNYALQTELIENISSVVGEEAPVIQEVDPSTNMLSTLLNDGLAVYSDRSAARSDDREHHRTASKKLFNDLPPALTDHHTVTVLPKDGERQNLAQHPVSGMPKKRILDPKTLVKAPDDIEGEFDITKVCGLIAIYKSEEGNLQGLRQKIGLVGVPPKYNDKQEQGYYKALHDYYYTTKGVQYDEPSTHPAIYTQDWGYSLIFTGDVGFKALPAQLPKALQVGKKYIFDLTHHTVFVTMKKQLNPGYQFGNEEPVSDFFNFQSDGNNFNTGEAKQNVMNIYEK